MSYRDLEVRRAYKSKWSKERRMALKLVDPERLHEEDRRTHRNRHYDPTAPKNNVATYRLMVINLLIQRDGNTCSICGNELPFEPKEMDVHHTVSRTNGGGNDADNLRLTHSYCNRSSLCYEAEVH